MVFELVEDTSCAGNWMIKCPSGILPVSFSDKERAQSSVNALIMTQRARVIKEINDAAQNQEEFTG
jgi:hypothetical protein